MEHPKTYIHLPDIPQQVVSASQAYEIAFSLARTGDVLGWRQLVKRIRPNVFKSLVLWRRNELDETEPKSKEQFIQVVDQAVKIISPLMSVALVGVESRTEHFNDQKSLLYDLLSIPGWSSVGHTVWVNIPYALGYVYHSLHGGISLNTNQLNLALSLARVKTPIADGTKSLRLWERSEFRGYSESISGKRGGNCIESWEYLIEAYERWEWLSPIFGDESEYRTSLVAYYMALHIHELATVIASGGQDMLKTDSNPYFHIPLIFLSESYAIYQRATSLLIRNPDVLTELWTCLNVTRAQMENSWRTWIRLSEIWLRSIFQFSSTGRVFYHNTTYHQNFFELL